MARRTGGQGAITLASGEIAALRSWTYTETDVDMDTSAAGDDWEDSESLRGRFEIAFEALLEVATPYVIPTTLRGTKVAFVLKVRDSDTSGLISGTAKVDQLEIGTPYDGAVTISGRLKTAGVAPVWDLTPA